MILVKLGNCGRMQVPTMVCNIELHQLPQKKNKNKKKDAKSIIIEIIPGQEKNDSIRTQQQRQLYHHQHQQQPHQGDLLNHKGKFVDIIQQVSFYVCVLGLSGITQL